VGGEDLKTYLDLMFSIEQFKVIQPETKASYYALDTIYVAQAYFQHGFLEIAGVTPIAEDLIEVGRRFTQVIDLAYTRFLDLQKAEAQTREAQIQLALERVRARTMAMQHSDELADVSYLLNKQVVELGIPTRGCAFNIYNEHDSTEWFSNIDGTLPAYKTPREKVFLKYYDAGLRGEKLLIEEYGKDSIRQHYEYLFSLGYFGRPNNKKETLAKVMPESQVDHVAYFKYGYLLFITLESAPEAHDIFKRFAKEFEQTYTRFLDLQKSEAQTREAQIQLALERVRARSLAMHHTSELQDVVDVVAQQLHHIGIDINGGVFIVINEEVNNDLPIWASAGAADYLQKVIVPFFNKRIFVHLRDAFKKRNYFFEETYTKKEKDDMFRHLFKFPPWRTMSATRKRELLAREGGLTRLAVISQYTSIALTNHNGKQFSEADKEILKRFGTVFEQAYTRFLDLQKAEAQAREAQIEASLEKVRSVAMGMHKAADLLDICETSYAELIKLGFTELRNTMINIHDDAEETFLNYDYSVYAGKAVTKYGYHIHPVIRNLVSKSRAAQDAFVDIGLYGSEFDEWKKFRSKSGEQDDDRLNSINHLNYYFYSIGIGSIGISTFESISEQKLNTLKRFRNVFQLAYQRFTDLTLAEAQAREAQIETALERVRARTMAMQKSEELSAVAHVLFEEFKQLNLSLGDKLSRAFVITVDEEKESFQFFITTSEGNYLPVVYPLPFKEKTNGVLLANCWHSGEAMLINVIEGAAYKQWLKYLDSIQLYISPEIKALKKRVNHYVRFSKGFLGITANEVLEDDAVTLLQRFAKVFDQTFTRFVDLQIAEASAKEAIKQAALDRIRANIASMRRVEDLDRITPIIWNELRVLGIPFVRCGIFIMDESLQQIHTFLSSPNGGHIAAYYMRFQETPHIYAMVEHWRKHAKFIERWTLSEFTLLATSLYQQGAIKDQAQYLQSIPADGMWLHFIPFIQGMLYVGNESSLPEDAIDTLAAVADAFSTAYARYEDFNKLEQAKTQVENTLVDLKQAQKQLVQSEKMASLGELTAGIAHEIQNPLNFVNNFSEVTQELLEELRQELKHGNTDGVQDLMDDIIQNLEKINHHGKRADGIVKGMLQHSRTSSGQKELIDINILCDEYLRLSYHGLRAKDKSFNAKFETSFDDTITKVNVMPQEMGRVILNLINNAFYAVSKKQQDGAVDYVPTVRISTQKDADKILISVQDNGMGIPEQIKDKIFQPFFTTKPTGQGTGLGLSLSYDIIKAHGGQLSVISAEGEGTTFLIQLSTTV
jgi:signal transduction histidine kinase